MAHDKEMFAGDMSPNRGELKAHDAFAIGLDDFAGYNQLVAALYGCLNSNSGFHPFFDAFKSHFRCLQGGLLGLTNAPIRMIYGWTFGYPDGFEQWYINSDLPQQDEALLKYTALSPRQFGSFTGGDPNVDFMAMMGEQSRVWAEEAGLGDSAGMLVCRNDESQIVFMTNRHRDEGPYTETELLKMNMLAPHIENAVKLHQKLYHSKGDSENLSAALNHVSKPMIVFNEVAQVVQCNAAAEVVLAKHPGLFVTDSQEQRLKSRHARFNRKLESAIVTSIFNARHGIQDIITLFDETDDERIAICLTPLVEGENNHHGALAELVLFNAANPVDQNRLQELFQCTPAEARTASLLAQGMTAESIAEELSISVHTVRQYIKSLLGKNGYRRQTQLVAAMVRALG
ncbi:MAG: LuxR family transcriptional regulator [Alteromonadaceae bacterium]|nr:LuxR family transcriptional regulator [Alteromonadaceae bacterium]MBH86200.1 LuxR family transcriptional regulator [Alteromonadaceae bacterium]|tara:strand:- start:1932 stop:3134 length:1203 start_codon:yes stop_codon:yes gene_type:complete